MQLLLCIPNFQVSKYEASSRGCSLDTLVDIIMHCVTGVSSTHCCSIHHHVVTILEVIQHIQDDTCAGAAGWLACPANANVNVNVNVMATCEMEVMVMVGGSCCCACCMVIVTLGN